MVRTQILGTGCSLPEKVVTNAELAQRMTTSDAWIQQRTGIKERRHVDFTQQPMGSATLGAQAGRAALQAAGVSKDEIDLIVYCTLSPDRVFPGDGVAVQQQLDIPAGVPAIDIRNQCSGFIYGLAVADAFIRSKAYNRVLLIGAEVQSSGLDFSDRGRDMAVLFGDGAGAVVLAGVGETGRPQRGILQVTLHADGRFADELHCSYPSSAQNPRVAAEPLADGAHYPAMNGKTVFKHAVQRMPECVLAVLAAEGLQPSDLDLLVPHQANLRIIETVQRRLELPDSKVFSNIDRYGNTTAASIPIALDEAVRGGRLKAGHLLCLTAFGAGFTWGAALIRW